MDIFNFNLGVWDAPVTILIILWSVFWKGLSLWHSATRRQGWWFVVLLVVNSVGILDIIYLYVVLKLKSRELIPKRNA